MKISPFPYTKLHWCFCDNHYFIMMARTRNSLKHLKQIIKQHRKIIKAWQKKAMHCHMVRRKINFEEDATTMRKRMHPHITSYTRFIQEKCFHAVYYRKIKMIRYCLTNWKKFRAEQWPASKLSRRGNEMVSPAQWNEEYKILKEDKCKLYKPATRCQSTTYFDADGNAGRIGRQYQQCQWWCHKDQKVTIF